VRRSRLPEILMAAGVVLLAVAGISRWTQANGDAPAQPAVIQPTPFPTPVPSTATSGPTAAAEPTAVQEAPIQTEQPSPTPALSPTVPTSPTATATPVAAASPPNRIVIPSIEVDAPVVEVGWVVVERDGQLTTEWEVADYAAGFHKGSAYPGNPGNTVLSGHNNIRGKVFRYLSDMSVDDEIILYVDDRNYHYYVESVDILPERYASAAQRTENARLIGYFPDVRLTLVTCWPYTSNTHRVVVIAKPAPLPDDAQ